MNKNNKKNVNLDVTPEKPISRHWSWTEMTMYNFLCTTTTHLMPMASFWSDRDISPFCFHLWFMSLKSPVSSQWVKVMVCDIIINFEILKGKKKCYLCQFSEPNKPTSYPCRCGGWYASTVLSFPVSPALNLLCCQRKAYPRKNKNDVFMKERAICSHFFL